MTTKPPLSTTKYENNASDPSQFQSVRLTWKGGLFMRNRKLILSVLLSVVILSSVYCLFAYEPQYASEASVIIRDSAINAQYVFKEDSQNTSTSTSLSTNPVFNTMELLKSQSIKEALWNQFLKHHPDEMKRLDIESYKDWEDLYGDGKKILKFKNMAGTDVIKVNFKWSDPRLAQEGLSIVLDTFRQDSQKLNQSQYHERYLYLVSQEKLIADQLAGLRKQISQFKQSNKVYDIDKEIESYTKDRLDLELELKKADADAGNYQAQTNAYEKTLKMPVEKAVAATSLGRDQSLSKLFDQYYSLSENYANLLSRYTENHPQVQQTALQLKQVKEDIQNEIARNSGGKVKSEDIDTRAITDDAQAHAVQNMVDVQAQSNGSRKKANLIRQYYNDIEHRMSDLPKIQMTLEALQNKEQNLNDALLNIQRQALDAKIRELQTVSNILIIDKPNLPYKEQFPNKRHIMVLGPIFGLLAGFALAYYKERFFKKSLPMTHLRDPFLVMEMENATPITT